MYISYFFIKFINYYFSGSQPLIFCLIVPVTISSIAKPEGSACRDTCNALHRYKKAWHKSIHQAIHFLRHFSSHRDNDTLKHRDIDLLQFCSDLCIDQNVAMIHDTFVAFPAHVRWYMPNLLILLYFFFELVTTLFVPVNLILPKPNDLIQILIFMILNPENLPIRMLVYVNLHFYC